MKRFFLFIVLGLILLCNFKIYSNDNNNYVKIELLPGFENQGIELLYEYTNITNEIGIIESGWTDLVGDNRNTEYYIKFYIEQTQMYYIVLLSKRFPEVLYYKSWHAGNEQYNITFFRRNDKPYAIIDYRGGSGRYYVFSIFEYVYRSSLFSPFVIMYEEDLGFDGWFEINNEKIIFYKDDGIKYFLWFENNKFELEELME